MAPNTKRHPYYAKQNHVRRTKRGETKTEIFIDGGVFPSPTFTVAPSVTATELAVGDNVSLRLGSWINGAPYGQLIADGEDVTDEIVDGDWSPSQPYTLWQWIVRAAGPGGVASFPPISGTVVPGEIVLGPQDFALYSTFEAPGNVGDLVASVDISGTVTASMVPSASPNDIVKSADGIAFPGTRYMLRNPLAGITNKRGILAVMRAKMQSAGTTQQMLVLYNGASPFLSLRTANANTQINIGAGLNGTTQNINLKPFVVGEVITIVAELDVDNQMLRYWNSATELVTEQIISIPANLSVTRIHSGQGAVNSEIQFIAVGTKSLEGEWDTTFEDAVQAYINQSNTPVTPDPITFASVPLHQSRGQSLALGPNIGGLISPTGQRWRDVFKNPRVRMLTGTKRADGVNITHVASPLLQGYDFDTDSTGETEAVALTNVPTGMIVSIGLAEELYPTTYGVNFQFHDAGGQEVANLDKDPATGQAGVVQPYQNAEYHLSQAVRIYAANNVLVDFVDYDQGEANAGDARGVFASEFYVTWDDMVEQYARILGQTTPPTLCMFQTGGYMSKNNDHFMVLDQNDVIEALDGYLIGPNYAHLIDNADGRGVHMSIIGHLERAYLSVWQKVEVSAGRQWNMFEGAITRAGDVITIPVGVRSDEALTAEPNKYDNYGGGAANLGFEVEGGGSITSVSVLADRIELTVTGTVTHVSYAFQRAAGIDYRNFLDENGFGYVAHRGCIRSNLTREVLAPGNVGLTLKRWLRTFRKPVTGV